MNKTVSISVLSALFVALAGCNDDSSSGGSSSSIDENPPESRTAARSSASLSPSGDTGKLSKMFAGGLNGQVPGGSDADDFTMLSGTIEARNSQPSNTGEALLSELITQIQLVNERRQSGVSARSEEEFNPEDMFEQFCETGSASYSQSDTSVSLDFNNCRTNMGDEGEMRISGSFSVSASGGGLDDAIDASCSDDSISTTMKADDLWFRMYDASGDRIESAFMAADVTFDATETCDGSGDTATTTAFVKGPYFFVDFNDDWFGFYEFEFETTLDESGTDDLVSGSIDFTFDSSELDGSLTVKTEEDFAARVNNDYPHAGVMKISSGGDELEFTFNDFSGPDDEQVAITGRSNDTDVCSGKSSWAQMNNGQARCDE